eukprot:1737511-Pleurochrysis_carterae.AAC.2
MAYSSPSSVLPKKTSSPCAIASPTIAVKAPPATAHESGRACSWRAYHRSGLDSFSHGVALPSRPSLHTSCQARWRAAIPTFSSLRMTNGNDIVILLLKSIESTSASE